MSIKPGCAARLSRCGAAMMKTEMNNEDTKDVDDDDDSNHDNNNNNDTGDEDEDDEYVPLAGGRKLSGKEKERDAERERVRGRGIRGHGRRCTLCLIVEAGIPRVEKQKQGQCMGAAGDDNKGNTTVNPVVWMHRVV